MPHVERHDSLAPETDIWRHSPLRFAGYANELGESFRPLVRPLWVYASYAVSIAYVLGDTWDKSAAAGRTATSRGVDPRPEVVATALDVVSWQMTASVLVPGFTINRVVAAARYAFNAAGRKPGLGPTLIGLGTIPLIVKPIDEATEYAFDYLLRPLLHEQKARIAGRVTSGTAPPAVTRPPVHSGGGGFGVTPSTVSRSESSR